MGFGSPLHWIVLVLVVVLLFGGGRISSVMGDVAKGIKSFKKGMADDDDAPQAQQAARPVQQIDAPVGSHEPAKSVAPHPVTNDPERG